MATDWWRDKSEQRVQTFQSQRKELLSMLITSGQAFYSDLKRHRPGKESAIRAGGYSEDSPSEVMRRGPLQGHPHKAERIAKERGSLRFQRPDTLSARETSIRLWK